MPTQTFYISVDIGGNFISFELPPTYDEWFVQAGEGNFIPVLGSDGATTLYLKFDVGTLGVTYHVFLDDIGYDGNEIEITSLTPRIIDNAAVPLLYWSLDTEWSGRADVSYFFQAVHNTEALHRTEWTTDFYYRPYDNVQAGQVARFQIEPTTPFVVVSTSVFITHDDPVGILDITVPVIDFVDAESATTWSNVIKKWDTYTSINQIVESSNLPLTLDWFANLAQGVLGISLCPGVTIGGLVLAFIAIPLVVAFLKLFAGG